MYSPFVVANNYTLWIVINVLLDSDLLHNKSFVRLG